MGTAAKEPQAIGKSRAGNTTKIHLTVDDYGFPVEFEITGGDVNDYSAAPDVVTYVKCQQTLVLHE